MSTCPGPCNNPGRRSRRGSRDSVARPVPGEPIWCRRCQALLRARLVELDDLAARLGAHLDRPQRGLQERVSGGGSRPSPSAAVDDLDELLHTLLGWEDAYREVRRLAPRPRRGRYAATLSGCVAWLAHHLDGLLAFDGAADFGGEILAMHRRLRSRTDSGPQPGRTSAPCPECDLMTLVHDPGSGGVRCRACRWSADPADYEPVETRPAGAGHRRTGPHRRTGHGGTGHGGTGRSGGSGRSDPGGRRDASGPGRRVERRAS